LQTLQPIQVIGLKKSYSSNISYLNVIIQMLWNMKVVRRFIQTDIKLDKSDIDKDINQRSFLVNIQVSFYFMITHNR